MKKRDAIRALQRADAAWAKAARVYLLAARWKHDNDAQGIVSWNDPQASWRWCTLEEGVGVQAERDRQDMPAIMGARWNRGDRGGARPMRPKRSEPIPK